MDRPGVIFSVTGSRLTRLEESEYDSEARLQKLLADYPDLLAGDQIDSDSPRRWVLVKREAGVPGDQGGADRWYLDHLFLDQDGIPTLIEVKRSSDTRIRREVVAQMLDYAANATVFWPSDEMRRQFEATCRERSLDPAAELCRCTGSDTLSEADLDSFWQKVRTNLEAGRVRLVFVADVIPKELRRVIEFLNGQMDQAEVLGIEIRQYVGPESQTLVPRVVGQTAQSEQKKRPARSAGRQWDQASLVEHIGQTAGPAASGVARRFIEWVERRGLPAECTQAESGSYVPWVEHNGESYYPFSLRAGGIIQVSFHGKYLAAKAAFRDSARLRELVQRLNQIGGVSIPESAIDGKAKIELTALAEGDRLDKFLQVFDWLIGVIEATPATVNGSG